MDCRKNYTRPQTIQKCISNLNQAGTSSSPVRIRLRSTYTFEFNENCLFCDHPCSKELETKLNKDCRDSIVYVSTLHFKQSVLDLANKRNYEWSKQVLRRINSVICLVSEEAKYHKSCERKFFNYIPSTENRKRGRPHDELLANAFSNLCDFIESANECQFSMNDLFDKMDGVCDEKTLKNKLMFKYGDDIIITTTRGKNL